MPDPRSVAILTAREVTEAWRNRWFLLFACGFGVLAVAMSWLSMAGASANGFAGLARTAASLLNLAVLIVPLMGLALGAGAIAPERERGTLLYLLAQPVSLTEVLLGKFLGLAAAVFAALLAGFGLAGLGLARRGGAEAGTYLRFLGLALLLGAASVALGLLISALARRASVALGMALFLWFGLVFAGDLGLMGTSITLRLGTGQLATAALANPLEVYRVASILVIRGGLEVLGPAGLYLVHTHGEALLPALVGILLAWIAAPLLLAGRVLAKRGVLP